MADSDSITTELSDDTSWGYLASQEVGRLGVIHNDLPDIYPVNYCLDGQSIVFRTAVGSKLEALTLNYHVVFEADGWDEETGWSVVLHGMAGVITDEDELRRAERLPLLPWVPTVKRTWVRIVPDELTGRTFVFGPEPMV